MLNKFLVLFLMSLLLFACGSKSKEEMLQEGIKLTQEGNVNGGIVLFRNALEKDPNFVEARYQLAKGYLATDKYEQAERELQKVKLQDPSNVELDALLAKAYIETDRHEEALALIENYLKSQPPTAEALVIKGRAYLVKKEFPQALEAFAKARELDPQYLHAYLGLVSVHLAEGRVDEALPILKTATELHPTDKRAFVLMANLFTAQGRTEESLEVWKKVLAIDARDAEALYQVGLLSLNEGNLEEGSKYAEDLVAKHPNRPQGHQLRGLVYYQKGDYDRAAESFQRSLAQGSNLQSHYFLGLCQYRLGKYELALSEFNRALDLNPDFTLARMMAASTLLLQKRVDDAIFQAQTAVVSDPRNAWAHNILGSALIMKGRFDEGMASFEQAIRLDPSLSSVHLKKGAVSFGMGDLQSAEKAMIDAVRANPEALESRFALALLYVRQGQPQKAVESLKEGLSGREEDAFIHYQLANLHFQMQQFDAGVAALEQAKKSNPGFLSPYFSLGIYHLAKAEPAKALAEYEGILARDPKNFQALILAANTRDQMDQRAQAVETFKKAIEVDGVRGTLAYAYNLLRRNEQPQALSVVSEGLAKAPNDPLLLELRGKIHGMRQDFSSAVTDFQALAKISPDKGNPLLAQALVQAGRGEEAVDLSKGLIASSPEAPQGYLLLTAVYAATNRPEQALTTLDEGMAKVKDAKPLAMNKAALLLGQKQQDKALAVYDGILAETPDFFPALYAKASIHHQVGNFSEAARLLKAAVEINPNYVPALNDLAYLLIDQQKQPKDGLDYAMRAFRLAPTEPAVMDTLGYAFYRNGQSDRARPLLEAAAKSLPDNGTVLFHLAQVYKDLGEAELAVQVLEQSLGKGDFPEQASARDLLDRLKKM
ncbi:XrtA/PEP-CTERM system TPR-repeat protein PrsT [Geoalkalibacter sp.]|uniref:XrtA/PEP-CTERM system TPR-repeat protein PrsT n=1 Tax=Geoalkalibacter sp. TaxID=3041440 RepID=UPI00272DFDD3|nr:XrtA/PEP-CTERM system TPR-repeat protein PrsT [Geoalkalibacter sp.]